MSTLDTKKALRLRQLRTGLSLYFVILSLAFLTMPLRRPFRSDMTPLGLIAVLCGSVFGAASWLALRERRSEVVRGRGWLIGASLLNLLIFLAAPLASGYSSGVASFWAFEGWFWVPQVIGVVGLIVFSQRSAPPATSR